MSVYKKFTVRIEQCIPRRYKRTILARSREEAEKLATYAAQETSELGGWDIDVSKIIDGGFVDLSHGPLLCKLVSLEEVGPLDEEA